MSIENWGIQDYRERSGAWHDQFGGKMTWANLGRRTNANGEASLESGNQLIDTAYVYSLGE